MVKLNQDTAARFLFLQASHSPSPAPSSLIPSLCSRGRVPGERVPLAHGSHATPWLQENRVPLIYIKGQEGGILPKEVGGLCLKAGEMMFVPVYHHDPSPGSRSLNILPRLVISSFNSYFKSLKSSSFVSDKLGNIGECTEVRLTITPGQERYAGTLWKTGMYSHPRVIYFSVLDENLLYYLRHSNSRETESSHTIEKVTSPLCTSISFHAWHMVGAPRTFTVEL